MPLSPDSHDPVVLRALAVLDVSDARDCPPPDVAYERLDARITQARPAFVSASPNSGSRDWRGSTLRRNLLVAGAVVGVMVVAAGTWRAFRVPVESQRAPVSAEHEYATAKGQRATITLRDGTQVTLNVASRLHVPQDFGTTSRVATLEGEAQFTVTHDEAHPFIVHANGAIVRDLATSFNVRAYPNAPVTSVTVREGRITLRSQIGTPMTAVIVDANQRATVALDGTTHVSAVTDAEDDFDWARGRLVLRLAPVGAAFVQLTRWYDLDFRVTDRRLLARHLSAVLPATITPQVLDDIATALNARVERSGGVVTFTPNP